MAADNRSRRLAVLIDADNTSSKIADGLFEYVARLGEASVRRIYGDFSSSRTKGWADTLTRHAIVPHQQFAYSPGKNSTDIALVIDAMDLLWSGRLDGFCLVASDGDFTRLATRIREEGLYVHGFGERQAPECFRLACGEFTLTERFVTDLPSPPNQEVVRVSSAATDAIRILEEILSRMKSEDGWVSLADLGSQLSKTQITFDPRKYGSGKLSNILRMTGAFELKQAGNAMRVKRKSPR